MIHIAVRVRELVSSNVDSMVGSASNPAKMLKLLRTEIEESLITLHGDLSKAKRQHERLLAEAEATSARAEEWTAKARTAMDHKREDLARSALLAREDERAEAEKLRDAARDASETVKELTDAIERLEAKRTEAIAKLKDLPREAQGASAAGTGDTKAERHLDRIERMERRVDLTSEARAQPAPASVDAEIAALRRDAELAAELAAMKARAGSTKPATRKAK